jgi:hypothetical protein
MSLLIFLVSDGRRTCFYCGSGTRTYFVCGGGTREKFEKALFCITPVARYKIDPPRRPVEEVADEARRPCTSGLSVVCSRVARPRATAPCIFF